MDTGRKARRSGAGDWKWKRRDEVHSTARRMVDEVATTEEGMDAPQPPNPDRLLRHFIYGRGWKLRLTPGDAGEVWFKVYWKVGGEPLYLACCAPVGSTFFSGLRALCQVIAEVDLGFRRPSPDRWQG